MRSTASNPPANASQNIARYQRFLTEFRAAAHLASEQDAQREQKDQERFTRLLSDFKVVLGNWQRGQESRADNFNWLEVVDWPHDENRHSMVVTWLLDPRMQRRGTHAQGKLGFRLFLEEFRELGLKPEYADHDFDVYREVASEESRIDIRIESPGNFVIDIENKIRTKEGYKQTSREWSDLEKRAKELSVPKPAIHALFLTPDGRAPENLNFKAIEYTKVAKVFQRFSKQAKAPEVKLFAAHYAKVLHKFICRQPAQPLEETP